MLTTPGAVGFAQRCKDTIHSPLCRPKVSCDAAPRRRHHQPGSSVPARVVEDSRNGTITTASRVLTNAPSRTRSKRPGGEEKPRRWRRGETGERAPQGVTRREYSELLRKGRPAPRLRPGHPRTALSPSMKQRATARFSELEANQDVSCFPPRRTLQVPCNTLRRLFRARLSKT